MYGYEVNTPGKNHSLGSCPGMVTRLTLVRITHSGAVQVWLRG